MKNSSDPSREQESPAPVETQTPSERLERIEAAVKLVADHLQATSIGAQIIETEQTRRVLIAVALGISATSILALLSLAAIFPAVSSHLLGLALAMSLILLGSVLDLSAGNFVRTAINKAIQDRDFSGVALLSNPGFRLLRPRYWAKLRQASPDLFFHQLARYSALIIYIVAILYILWVVISLYSR